MCKFFELPDECMVCYEHFPVALQFPCCHEFCASCVHSIINVCDNKNCPKCRKPLPCTLSECQIMIYPILIQNIPLEQLQLSFPLICSVANLSTVAKCTQMGVDLNTKGFFGKFPLTHATQATQINVVKYLVDRGADVNHPINGYATPLSVNSQKGNFLVVQYLIKKWCECKSTHQWWYNSSLYKLPRRAFNNC